MRKNEYKKILQLVYIMASKVSKVSTKEKSTKATKAAKTVVEEVIVAPTPVLAPVPAPEPVAPAPSTTPEPTQSLHDLFTNLNKAFQDLNSHVSLLKSEFRQVEKQVTREMRVLDKMNARRNKNKGNRAPKRLREAHED